MLLDSLLGIGGKLIDKLIPDPAQKAEAQLKLAELEQSGELAKMANETKMYELEQVNVTERWKDDMASDSWLSKNIRPLSLVAIFVGYFLFAFMSAFGYNANEGYVNLLGQWGMLIMSAYFGGKTLENIIAMKTRKD
ncbi:Holin of 3TMs, for gene-transfer release [uncultured Caudovirales phage]|jgi:Holin of 3TMs, for gene-transfer release|uniref:Holin of 3TMs, for gene-transfer release n=1 Tax=uncultured Caudovirales phage TaxID=2100421 RepID=A0A6J5T7N8_9CAUD|nr:Holin of 3TMs, for gene-transfer release [uncultured Caudovirales phage]